jgi:hypothetical protein
MPPPDYLRADVDAVMLLVAVDYDTPLTVEA